MLISFLLIVFNRLERAKKLQEQREKEMVEKQKQQEIAAGISLGSAGGKAAVLAAGAPRKPVPSCLVLCASFC